MSNRELLKAIAKGLKPVYVIYYYVQDGKICIFSGCKGYPEDKQETNLIIPCIGKETRPDNEVIRAYEALQKEM